MTGLVRRTIRRVLARQARRRYQFFRLTIGEPGLMAFALGTVRFAARQRRRRRARPLYRVTFGADSRLGVATYEPLPRRLRSRALRRRLEELARADIESAGKR